MCPPGVRLCSQGLLGNVRWEHFRRIYNQLSEVRVRSIYPNEEQFLFTTFVKFDQVASPSCVGSRGLVWRARSKAQHSMLWSRKAELPFCSSFSCQSCCLFTHWIPALDIYMCCLKSASPMEMGIFIFWFQRNLSAFSRIIQLVTSASGVRFARSLVLSVVNPWEPWT